VKFSFVSLLTEYEKFSVGKTRNTIALRLNFTLVIPILA